MLANKQIFCNTPWYELHIYWDGSFGICCSEDHKLYNVNETKYNIANMSIMEWFNSEPARTFRTKILKDQKLSECRRCMAEEDANGNSRRFKSNQKSVIFTKTAFEPSLLQSPGYKHFEYSANNNGHTNTYPIDLHIDLGNYCNLACKMCNAQTSSTIASQHVKWGIESDRKFLGVDWTRNQSVWDSFKNQLLEIPNLTNIHFMGGETVITDRFEDLIDTMIANERYDLSFSFVSNGTVFKPLLVEKLKKFRRVGIEISIESLSLHNEYIRQGTENKQVLENIKKYIAHSNNDSISVTLRPAPSLLSVGYYADLLQFALDNQLVVKSNLCTEPSFLKIENLPSDIKELYKEKYKNFLEQFKNNSKKDYNASDPHEIESIVRDEAEMCLTLLSKQQPDNVDSEFQFLIEHCRKWDKVYKLDARKLYPELVDIWDKYDY